MTGMKRSRGDAVEIIGAVPRSVKNRRAVDKAFAPARKELLALLEYAASRRRVSK